MVVQDVLGDAKDNIKIKKIYHFFKTIGTKYIGEGVAKKFVENNYDTVFKIIESDKDDLVDIDGIGDKLVDKIFLEIDRSLKEAVLELIIAGSTIFGRGFGIKKSKVIVSRFPDILIGNYGVEDIISLEGFDDVMANYFMDGLEEFKVFYFKLESTGKLSLKNGMLLKGKSLDKGKSKNNVPFDGMKIVVTGTRDKYVLSFIEAMGGSISSSVSKKTNLLIYVDDKTSKYIRAKELNIETIHLNEFISKYMSNR